MRGCGAKTKLLGLKIGARLALALDVTAAPEVLSQVDPMEKVQCKIEAALCPNLTTIPGIPPTSS